ncbi:ser arg-related nuclear matrix protein [Seiridium cupressi]
MSDRPPFHVGDQGSIIPKSDNETDMAKAYSKKTADCSQLSVVWFHKIIWEHRLLSMGSAAGRSPRMEGTSTRPYLTAADQTPDYAALSAEILRGRMKQRHYDGLSKAQLTDFNGGNGYLPLRGRSPVPKMRERVDIGEFLENGYWANSRARTPEPKLSSQSHNDSSVPRFSHSTKYPLALRRRSFCPPKPTVEDENEALEKEHGSIASAYPHEEPQHPGARDQEHVLENTHEYNTERRFVIVENSSPSLDEPLDELRKAARARRVGAKDEKPAPNKEDDTYEANTCRKYVIVPTEGEEDKDKPKPKPTREEGEKRPNRERRKSKLEELPAIVTDLDRNERSDARSGARTDARREDIRRSKSATGRESGTNDYFLPRLGPQRRREESMLSPDIVINATKGRDRAYYDYSGAQTSNQGRTRTNEPESAREKRYSRRPDESHARPFSAGPAGPRKAPETPRNVRRTSKEGSVGYDREYSGYDRPRQNSERPSRTSRTNSSSATSRPDRESPKLRSSSFRGKGESPPYQDSRYSSEEEPQRRGPRRRRTSFVREERNGHLATPSDAKPLGRRSKPSTPLASPRGSQGEFFLEHHESNMSRSPRSATFPVNYQKTEPKHAAEEELPPRPLSRASTARSALSSAAPIAIPVITAAAVAASRDAESPTDRRFAAMPVPHKARVVAESRSNSYSSSSTPSGSSPPKRTWQPPKFDPYKDGVQPEDHASYRRYSEGYKGELPNLPECSRTREEAGHVDWLTLPKCNNFNICPSCYQSAFGNTQWRNAFVPAPFRPLDRPLKCDFGASTWYHIAWLLIHRYQKPDLRMFQGLNNVTASHQACSGDQVAFRIWYTIKDPVTQQPVRAFKLCHHCAKSIETLLPNLSGVFVPMDSPAEAKSGICCMRQHGHAGTDRKRFLEYWDLMETTSDIALARNSAPDVRALADKVNEMSYVEECYGSRPVSERKWYVMRSVPGCTVCDECFDEVILPEIRRDPTGLQADFFKDSQKIELAACQLYSGRMRRYLREAIANDDLEYFRSKIYKRKQKEQEYYQRVVGLDQDRKQLGNEWADAEFERATKEWRRYE